MSDKKLNIEELSKEYQQLALKAGHLQYQLHALQKDLDLVNEQMRDKNLEAAKLNREAEETKLVEGK